MKFHTATALLLPLSTLAADVTPYSGNSSHACRFDSDWFLGSPSDPDAKIRPSNKYFDIESNVKHLSDCMDICTERTDCIGVEYGSRNRRCELWKVDIGSMEPVNGYGCYRKNVAPGYCIQPDVAFDAGYGRCEEYAKDHPTENFDYCSIDYVLSSDGTELLAEDACAECGKCTSAPVTPETSCPVHPPFNFETCEGDGRRCDYGEETCCGNTHVSITCECSGREFVCYHTEACISAQCDTIFGSVYVQQGLGLGAASYHFDAPDDSYISYENPPSTWKLDDGSSPPSRKEFEGAMFNEATRTFTGTVTWPVPFLGQAAWEYSMIFSEDFSEIVDGHVKVYGVEGAEIYTLSYGMDLVYGKEYV